MDKEHHGGPPSAQNPPPYSEKLSYDQGPPVAGPTMRSNAPYVAVPGQEAITQPPQHTTFFVPVQPTNEPDYLVFSILTLIFCCLPLGIAALIFSIRTRDSNHAGNGTEAKRNSRMARILAASALGVGIALMIVYIVLVVKTSEMFD